MQLKLHMLLHDVYVLECTIAADITAHDSPVTCIVGTGCFKVSRSCSHCISSTFVPLQVWIPWASAIAGEVQYQLVLACLWENAYEPSTFGRPVPMWHPVGVRLPKHPPQPEVLGVDRSRSPVWEVEVHIHAISWLMEKLPLQDSKPGCGPDLAKV